MKCGSLWYYHSDAILSCGYILEAVEPCTDLEGGGKKYFNVLNLHCKLLENRFGTFPEKKFLVLHIWTHAYMYNKTHVTYLPNILHPTGFHVLWAKSEPKTPLLNGDELWWRWRWWWWWMMKVEMIAIWCWNWY